MNGIGGGASFAQNAGLSVVLIPSVAKGGAISNIVPMVSHQDINEHDVDVIVTDYGIADLRGLDDGERADAIVTNCASETYRGQLTAYLRAARGQVGGHHPQLPAAAFGWYRRLKEEGTMLEEAMKKIELYEVGPRDGFQMVDEYIPLEIKVRIVEGLLDAGLRHLQITSFVSPKAIPQMRDAGDLAAKVIGKYPGCRSVCAWSQICAAPKRPGRRALPSVSYVVSLGESHNKANIRRTHEESFAGLQAIVEAYPDMDICLDLSTTFGCPFEGMKTEDDVVPFLKPYVDSGVRMVNLCDTIGIANPAQVRRIIEAVWAEYPSLDLQVHIHDTRNMGMVNTLAAIELGVDKVQSTLGGLGGCPFAPGASGNLATEDVAFMLSEMGYELGVDIPKMIALAKWQASAIPTGQFSGHQFRIPDTT